MLLLLLSLAAAAAAPAPATYDQRQEGDFNVRADVSNLVLLVAIPQKMPINANLLDSFFKDAKRQHEPHELQERADVHIMEAFVEPPAPYRVDLSAERSAGGGGGGGGGEVVIASRRAAGAEPEPQPAGGDEMKLLGATEQCGPGRVRDPATLACVHYIPNDHVDFEEAPPVDDKDPEKPPV